MNTNENARLAGTGRALGSAVMDGLLRNNTTCGFLSAALDLAAAGVPVFPCKPDKSPYIAGGFKAATTEAATIRTWADTFPDALVGVPTGEASGLFVLDVDRHGDIDGFTTLAALGFEVPRTQMHSTPSGGRHYLLRWQPGMKSSAGKIGQGIDTRGTGGYVIWWPQNGHRAENVGEIAAPPVWLIDALNKKPQEAAGAAPAKGSTDSDRYAQVALERAAGAVIAAPEGTRNDTLNREAHGLFGLALAGRLDSASVEDALTRAALAAGLDLVEVARTIESAKDAAHPRPAEHREAPASKKTEGGAHDPCSHLANAYRLAEHFGDRLLYVENVGWHTWGPPWRLDDLGARRIAQGLGKIIADEAAGMAAWVAQAADKTERDQRQQALDKRFRWAGQSESAPVIEFSLRMAQPLLAEQAENLDANPDLLGLPGGVLDLTTGKHRAHRQADRITKVAGTDFDQAATAPKWEQFIAEVMGGDADLIGYVQRLAGYALTGHRGEHILPFFWGSGANGKSTALGALQTMLGDYAGTAAPGLLIQRHGSEHPTGLADLQGRRLVVVSETGENGRLNEEQVKALTGGDRITARRMRQDFYSFEPSHLLLLQTNHRPRVAGTDEGIWRRLRLIPFTVTVPPERRDPRLPDKLKAELPGILNWCLAGLRAYQREGFTTPSAVRAATSEYRDASDQVGAFLADCCDVDDTATTAAAELYRAYQQWAQDAGERPRAQRDFGMRLSERGFERVRTGKGIRWRGLRLAVGSVGSERSEPTFGLNTREKVFREAHTEKPYTSFTSCTNDDRSTDPPVEAKPTQPDDDAALVASLVARFGGAA